MKTCVRGWAEFQHYKDRAPPWIKLHRKLLDSMDYNRLSPIAAKCLPLLWLIASEDDGQLPDVPRLAFRLRLDETTAGAVVHELIAGGFLCEGAETAEQVATPAQAAGWGSRHIPDKVKREVWMRDGGKCCACGSDEHVEYDHVIPVSLGGTSESSNIQLLCRACNRKKRTRVATHAQALRSLEGEGETETQHQKQKERTPPSASPPPRKRKPVLVPMPDGFAVSERVKTWAARKGFGRLDEHLEIFVGKCRAKGYQYTADGWDDALMGAIREDWGELRKTPAGHVRPVAGNSPEADDSPAARIEAQRQWLATEVREGRITREAAQVEFAKVKAKYEATA